MHHEQPCETTAQVVRAISFPRYVMAVLVQMIAAHGAALGLGLLLGGDVRLSGPSFGVVTMLAPSFVWGLAYLLTGIGLALVAWRKPKHTVRAAFVLALLHAFFSLALGAGVLTNPLATMTGWINYGGIAVLTTTVGYFHSWIAREWPR